MRGLIFNIRRYSIHDGPGIRVTFFMKGCPLSCLWCHNPEGISPLPESTIHTNRVGDREFHSLEEVGIFYSGTDIIEILNKELVFIDQSKGGVTFSGGEPMLQPEFLLETLKLCRENGFHTAIDTSGYSSVENYKSILPFTDIFLFDLKHMDDAKHKEYTGVSNKGILDNYRFLIQSGRDMIVRVPVIPGFNDDNLNLKKMRQFIMENRTDNLKGINLLPFHKTGSSKYKRFNLPYRMEDVEQPSAERMKELNLFFSEPDVKVKVGG